MTNMLQKSDEVDPRNRTPMASFQTLSTKENAGPLPC